MRLVFVAPSLHVGGIERQWAALIPGLAHRGHDVLVVTIDGRGRFFDELASRGVDVRCLGLRARGELWRLAPAFRLPAAPEIVVSCGVSGVVLGDFVARRYRARHVLEEQSGPDARGHMKELRRDQALLLRLVRPRLDRVIAVASVQVDALGRRGYADDCIAVIPNGISNDELVKTRSRAETRAELGIADGEFLVLFVATLRPEKRVDLFIEAVGRARRRAPRIRGIIAGGGPGYPSVQRATSGLRENGVVALGSRDDVADLLEAADALCLTSDIEAMPMSVLEAMAVGLPVVATRVGGVPELVVHETTGLLVPPGEADAFAEALVRLAGDADLCQRLGDEGRRRQRRLFTTQRMITSYADELGAVLRLPRVRRRPLVNGWATQSRS